MNPPAVILTHIAMYITAMIHGYETTGQVPPPSIVYNNDLLSIIIIMGVFQGIFLSFFFLRDKKKTRASNKYLGILLFLFAVHNLDFWASYSRFTLKFPFLLDISVSFTMAMGPLFYHYISKTVTNKSDKYLLIHYIPFLLFFVYSLFFILQPDAFKYNVFVSSRGINLPLREVNISHSFDPLNIRSYFGLLISIQLCLYLGMSYFVFVKQLRIRDQSFLKPGDNVFTWLRNLLFATTLIVVTAVIIQLVFPGGRVEFLLATWFTIFIYYLSINLIRGSYFLNQTLFPEKYRKSSLTEKMKNSYILKIEELMSVEKVYTDNLFSLKKLSRHTAIPPDQLSQILNESFHQTFFEFTRTYRINEAMDLLSSPSNSEINIEEIAHKVGYNSKSAFNKAFLNLTGQTPLNFKKKSLE